MKKRMFPKVLLGIGSLFYDILKLSFNWVQTLEQKYLWILTNQQMFQEIRHTRAWMQMAQGIDVYEEMTNPSVNFYYISKTASAM